MHISFLCRLPTSTKSYDTMKRAMQRSRAFALPKNAIDVAAIDDRYSIPENMQMYGKSLADGATFFKTAYECAEFSYCVFASDVLIDMMEADIPRALR